MVKVSFGIGILMQKHRNRSLFAEVLLCLCNDDSFHIISAQVQWYNCGFGVDGVVRVGFCRIGSGDL